jgi:acetate kinase
MREPILVLNAGSSSIKFSIFDAPDGSLSAGAHGQVEGIGISPWLELVNAQGGKHSNKRLAGADHASAIAAIHEWFAPDIGSEAGFDGVGHRIVHGGLTYSQPVLIDDEVIAALEALVPLAPLHQPHHVAAIRAVVPLRPRSHRLPASIPPSIELSLRSHRSSHCRVSSRPRECVS